MPPSSRHCWPRSPGWRRPSRCAPRLHPRVIVRCRRRADELLPAGQHTVGRQGRVRALGRRGCRRLRAVARGGRLQEAQEPQAAARGEAAEAAHVRCRPARVTALPSRLTCQLRAATRRRSRATSARPARRLPPPPCRPCGCRPRCRRWLAPSRSCRASTTRCVCARGPRGRPPPPTARRPRAAVRVGGRRVGAGHEGRCVQRERARRALFRVYNAPSGSGDLLLIDEISLADDAVLERLNSVLEPARTLLLAEKGGHHAEVIVAHPAFRVMATMNPGGDYGKKELSPALRNRCARARPPAWPVRCSVAAVRATDSRRSGWSRRTSARTFCSCEPRAAALSPCSPRPAASATACGMKRHTPAPARSPAPLLTPRAAERLRAGTAGLRRVVQQGRGAGPRALLTTGARSHEHCMSQGQRRPLSLRDVLAWVDFCNDAMSVKPNGVALARSAPCALC
jgi:hypothetical protein